MDHIFSYVTLASLIIMIVLILLQTRGASLGAGFGGSGELYTARRGVDKSMHQATIVVAFVFIASLVLSIVKG